MELRFLGQSYSASNIRINTVVSKQTACFKGQRYNLRVPVSTTQCDRQIGIRKYRGVTYTVEPQKQQSNLEKPTVFKNFEVV